MGSVSPLLARSCVYCARVSRCPACCPLLACCPPSVQVERAVLVGRLERALVSVVSEVGVDINAAGRLDHMAAVLAYVPGLGVRKAEGIRKKLRAKVPPESGCV